MTTYRQQAALRAKIWGTVLVAARVAAAEAADTPEAHPWYETAWTWLQARRDTLRARLWPADRKQVDMLCDRDACQLWVTRTAARIWGEQQWMPPVRLRMDAAGRWRVAEVGL